MHEAVQEYQTWWLAVNDTKKHLASYFYMSHDMTKPTKRLCAQRRLRLVWACAQSGQSLRCALNGSLRIQAFFMRTAKTLIRLGGCPGCDLSLRWAQSHFVGFCQVAAQLCLATVCYVLHWKTIWCIYHHTTDEGLQIFNGLTIKYPVVSAHSGQIPAHETVLSWLEESSF